MNAATTFISPETFVRVGFFAVIFFIVAQSENIAPQWKQV
jgi:hypothetical protein